MDQPTELCEIAKAYGTDKCPEIKHPYTPVYYDILKDKRDSIKKVVELGIGWYQGIDKIGYRKDERLNRVYHKGASLLMWRDFFPNAHVWGTDVRKDSMMDGFDRITTIHADARKEKDWDRVLEQTGTDIDLFIDDGSHRPADQAYVANLLLPKLKDDVIFIIEDVMHPDRVIEAFEDHVEYELLELENPRRRNRDDRLLIVKNKK
jgi:hypothetical protein